MGCPPATRLPDPTQLQPLSFLFPHSVFTPPTSPQKRPSALEKKTHTKKTPSAYLNPKTLISPLHLLSQPGGDMQVTVSPTGEIHGKDSFRQSCFSFLSPITSPNPQDPHSFCNSPGCSRHTNGWSALVGPMVPVRWVHPSGGGTGWLRLCHCDHAPQACK